MSPFPAPVAARSIVAIAVLLVTFASPAAGQKAEVYVAPGQASQAIVTGENDAREVRERFEALLRRLPPSVGRVLKVDPGLMTNEPYLSTYPSLSAFLKQYPEVRHNPGFYLARVTSDFWDPQPPPDPRSEAINMWRNMVESLAILAGFTIGTLCLIWIVRTLVEYRRWYRLSKIQADAHNKLLDRFTASEELLAYLQSPVGQRLFESAPLAPESPTRPVGAPLGRILWSIQVGVVLGAGAVGLLFVSTKVIEEVAQGLFVFGVLALAVGVGFIVSAAASFLLSRRLGLIETPRPASEHSAGAAGS